MHVRRFLLVDPGHPRLLKVKLELSLLLTMDKGTAPAAIDELWLDHLLNALSLQQLQPHLIIFIITLSLIYSIIASR